MASLKDYFKLHLIVFLWGTTAVMAKLISIPATEMLFYRTMLAAAGLFAVALISGTTIKASFPDVLKMLGIGFVVGLHWIAFFVGGQISTASLSLVGFATCSLWAAILEPLTQGKSIRPLEVFLGIMVMAGLYIILHFEFRFYNGLLLSIVSGFLAALFSVMNFHMVRRLPSVTIAFYEMAGAFFLIAAFLPFYRDYFAGGNLQLLPSPMDWVYLFILSVVCSVFAFTQSISLMKKISVFTLQLTLNLEPVYGILLAILLLGEDRYMGPAFITGTGIIMIAVFSYPALKRKFG
ncbi:MAG: DMT family transporter [Cyclobacteriaceae bacterium]